jgi:hypothetical protein
VLDVTSTLSYLPLQDLPTTGLAFNVIPYLSSNQPFTITLHYRDEDVSGMDEQSLQLYRYDWPDARWVQAEPCGGYTVYPDENIFVAWVCQLADYAVLDWPYRIYLPLTIKNSGP